MKCIPVLVVALQGCATTSYVPQTPGNLAVVMSSGSAKLQRDGRVYQASDLMQAVEGVPEAEKHARAFRTDATISGGLILTAAGLFAASLVVGLSDPAHNRGVAIGLDLGAAVPLLISAAFANSARSHFYDAVNAFNDHQLGRHGAGMADPH